MKLLLTLIFTPFLLTVHGQLTEKAASKLEKYESYLQAGDIYKAAKKADKLMKKYPDAGEVIDFRIRTTMALYTDSFEESKNAFVNSTASVVRKIWFREITDLLEKEFSKANSDNIRLCRYLEFLQMHGDEKLYDTSGPRTLNEMYAERLQDLHKKCQ